MTFVTTERRGRVAVLALANPPVNALSHGVRAGLLEAVNAANADPEVAAIVITGAGRAFSAGADITEFKGGRVEPALPDVINVIEASSKPVVAAVNGLALGGGLEVTLGCHARVVAKDVKQLGLPEVKIGLLPGAGGTQRLPRIIGVEAAIDFITSGAPIDAAKALASGLANSIAEGDVVAAAVAIAEELAAKGGTPDRVSARAIDVSKIPADLFDKRRAGLARHPSGPWAARACIDAIEASTKMPYADGLKRERQLFMEGLKTPYAQALQYAFFAERQAATLPDIGPEVKPRDIKSVGIIGAGTMGTGIALAFLNANIPVTIVEMAEPALAAGVKRVNETLEAAVKRGRATADEAKARAAMLTPTTDLNKLATVDLVIEAVFESMAVKKDVFGKLDVICKPGAILASNTSTLDVDEIAACTKRPQDVLGLHFFSPANIMRLLEIVRGKATAKDVMATAMGLSKRIAKVGVVSGVCFGFIGNRMLEAYGEEVQAMLLEGATPTDIDAALEGWGMAMGPLAVMDMAGIDVGWRIRKEHTISDERRRLYKVTDAIADSGRFGQKTGAGYYTYGADRKRSADPKVEAMYRDEAARQGIAQRNTIPPEEIVERCLLRLANAGAEILDEGIAMRSSDIDTIYLNGYGFPAWRGGPMWQVDANGVASAVEKIRAYEKKHGPRWKLSPLLDRLAKSGGSLSDAKKA